MGALSPTRDFNYVKDTVAGFLSIFESNQTIGEEINIATQTEISIQNLAEEIIRQLRPSARIVSDEQRIRPKDSEVNRLLGSNEKIMKLTSWKPKYTFEQGIQETIAFMQNNMSAYKSDIYNI